MHTAKCPNIFSLIVFTLVLFHQTAQASKALITTTPKSFVDALHLLFEEDVFSNTSPKADAGDDINTSVGMIVYLDGSGSSSPTASALSYSWLLVSKPPNSSSSIAAATTATPTINVDTVGTFIIKLTVKNQEGKSHSDSMIIQSIPNNKSRKDNFDGINPLLTTVNNPLDHDDDNDGVEDIMRVTKTTGRYLAEIFNNSGNQTLHFNEHQGRLDATLLNFPFEFIARNIGIGISSSDSQTAPPFTTNNFNFSGIQIHSLDLNERNSSHVVVGHRSPTAFTIEGKNTVNGQSTVNDIGENEVTSGRADIRIVGNEDHTLTIYWQQPNITPSTTPDNWQLYGPSWNPTPDGSLPGVSPLYGDQVYVGLITYAYFSSGIPFVGVCDSIEVIQK